MAKRILRTESGEYTMSDPCPRTGERAYEVKPPKYSPEDKYGRYRRQYKEMHAEKE
ncbi:MAG: nucleolar RNA-binding Nop10p family protein [Nanoarchaeota archaeon]